MVVPPHLKNGDTIGIVAPAGKISREDVTPAIKKFKEWGLNVIEGEFLYGQHHVFSGTEDERKADMQRMLDNPNIKAIICARGGYGSARFIDQLDLSKLVQYPKWLVGYSDITALHSHILSHCKIATIHGTMPVNFPQDGSDNNATNTLKKALFGEPLQYEIPVHPLNRQGEANGPLVGGNISMLYSLTGTPSDLDTKGKILFLEDLDEHTYHLDRMMINFKRSGKLDGLKGLIIGGLSDMKEGTTPFGKSPEEVILDAVKEYDFPVCFGFPAGHIEDNRALVLGGNVKIMVDSLVTLSF